MKTAENRKHNTEDRKMNLKSILNSQFLILNSSYRRGFILPFSMMLTYIILIISTGISTILVKEMFFSSIGRESQIAYYSADAGLDCALYLDGLFVDLDTGIGIFPYNDDTSAWETSFVTKYSNFISNLTDIKCANAEIFDPRQDYSNYSAVSTDNLNPLNGVTSTFVLRMNNGSENFDRATAPCAEVSVEKKLAADGVLFRRIISRGYNTCNKNSSRFVERAIVNVSK